MQLAGRLGRTTLGDLLGTLHRAGATGTLELTDDRTGRVHHIGLSAGLVVSVGPYTVSCAPRSVVAARLRMLEQLKDARICFRVAIRPSRNPETGVPLMPAEFLYGRRRARDGAPPSPPPAARETPPRPSYFRDSARESAPRPIRPEVTTPWSVLGVSPGADRSAIRTAFRALARKFHPDMHPQATEAERRRLTLRFSEVSAAYRELVA